MSELTLERKNKIADDLREYVNKQADGSRNRASKMLRGVNLAYISQILNGQMEAMSDSFWYNLEKQVSKTVDGDWVIVPDIANYEALSDLYNDARRYSSVYGVIGDPGWGKTCTARQDNSQTNSFLLECKESWDKREFMNQLLRQMGRSIESYRLNDLLNEAITHLKRLDNPMIKLDEVDKLPDAVLYFFISLYNELEGHCGMVLTGTPYLSLRIRKGADRNKKGYKEFLSRIGGRFIELEKPSREDIARVIQANGIHDPLEIQRIINDSDHDLRRVYRKVHAEKRKAEKLIAA